VAAFLFLISDATAGSPPDPAVTYREWFARHLTDLWLTGVLILALALGIAVNTVFFTAYKAFITRPLDARDPASLVNISLRLQSGETEARFSYPDFGAWRDGLRSLSGVIAFSIEQLTLSDADGVAGHRRQEAGMLLQGLGLLPPPGGQQGACEHVRRLGELLLGAGSGSRTRPRLPPPDHRGAQGLAGGTDQSELLARAVRE
jgi:hypothetical protein